MKILIVKASVMQQENSWAAEHYFGHVATIEHEIEDRQLEINAKRRRLYACQKELLTEKERVLELHTRFKPTLEHKNVDEA